MNPRVKFGGPRAPKARGLGRRVVVDWKLASPLPHTAFESAWLCGPCGLHSYSFASCALLPQFPCFLVALLLFSNLMRSACSIAMAPKQAEKGKRPLSLPAVPSSFAPALGRSRVLNDEAMDKVRPMLASSFNEWGKTVAWPASRTHMAQTVIRLQRIYNL